MLLAALVVSIPSQASWFTSKVDRIQILPNGNINFWLTTIPAGNCGATDKPLKAEINQFGVSPDGIKTFASILLTAITTKKDLDISVRDSECRVDSLTLHG